MNDNEEKFYDQLSDSTLRAINEARASYNRIAENIASIPKIDFPRIELPKLPDPGVKISALISSEVVREENEWKRHTEILNIQQSLLDIQLELLRDQKEGSKLTKRIFRLTVVGTIIALFTLLVTIFSLQTFSQWHALFSKLFP